MSPRQSHIVSIGVALASLGIACSQTAPPPAPTVIVDYAQAEPDASQSTSSDDSAARADNARTIEANVCEVGQLPAEGLDAASVLSTAIARAKDENRLLLVHVGAPG
jgi:hypothetical protein